MKELSNCFRISVDELPENIISLMNQYFDMKAETTRRYLLENHIVEIYINEDNDKVLSLIDGDGYLYYKSHMDFIPVERTCINTQIQLAKKVQCILSSVSWKSEIISEFEHLIDW